MFLRIHRSAENREVVGICDRELLGRIITEGVLSLNINEAFFGNQSAPDEEIIRVMKTADNITIYGNYCVGLAIREGIIDEENCLRIGGVLVATIIRL